MLTKDEVFEMIAWGLLQIFDLIAGRNTTSTRPLKIFRFLRALPSPTPDSNLMAVLDGVETFEGAFAYSMRFFKESYPDLNPVALDMFIYVLSDPLSFANPHYLLHNFAAVDRFLTETFKPGTASDLQLYYIECLNKELAIIPQAERRPMIPDILDVPPRMVLTAAATVPDLNLEEPNRRRATQPSYDAVDTSRVSFETLKSFPHDVNAWIAIYVSETLEEAYRFIEEHVCKSSIHQGGYAEYKKKHGYLRTKWQCGQKCANVDWVQGCSNVGKKKSISDKYCTFGYHTITKKLDGTFTGPTIVLVSKNKVWDTMMEQFTPESEDIETRGPHEDEWIKFEGGEGSKLGHCHSSHGEIAVTRRIKDQFADFVAHAYERLSNTLTKSLKSSAQAIVNVIGSITDPQHEFYKFKGVADIQYVSHIIRKKLNHVHTLDVDTVESVQEFFRVILQNGSVPGLERVFFNRFPIKGEEQASEKDLVVLCRQDWHGKLQIYITHIRGMINLCKTMFLYMDGTFKMCKVKSVVLSIVAKDAKKNIQTLGLCITETEDWRSYQVLLDLVLDNMPDFLRSGWVDPGTLVNHLGVVCDGLCGFAKSLVRLRETFVLSQVQTDDEDEDETVQADDAVEAEPVQVVEDEAEELGEISVSERPRRVIRRQVLMRRRIRKRMCYYHVLMASLRWFAKYGKTFLKETQDYLIKIITVLVRMRFRNQLRSLWLTMTSIFVLNVTQTELSAWNKYIQYFDKYYIQNVCAETSDWFGPIREQSIREIRCDRTSGPCENVNMRIKKNQSMEDTRNALLIRVSTFMLSEFDNNPQEFLTVVDYCTKALAEGFAACKGQKSRGINILKKAQPKSVNLPASEFEEGGQFFIFFFDYESEDIIALNQDECNSLFVDIDDRKLYQTINDGVFVLFRNNPEELRHADRGDCYCQDFRKGKQCFHIFHAYFACFELRKIRETGVVSQLDHFNILTLRVVKCFNCLLSLLNS
jgi:hypothetical protein